MSKEWLTKFQDSFHNIHYLIVNLLTNLLTIDCFPVKLFC